MPNALTQIIISAVDRTKAAITSAKNGLESIGSTAGNLKSLLGTIFTGLSVAGFIGQIRTVANEMDEARKAAKAAGTSVENFSALTYASSQSGGGPEVLQKALVKLVQSLHESDDATSKAAATWRSLGIDPRQFKDPADALLVLADRFASMPDGIARTNLAIDLFGEKIGPKMIPLLIEGREGITKLTDEAQRLGKVFDDETTAAAERLNDTLDRLKARQTSLFAKVLPSLTQYVSALDDVIERGSTLDKIKFFTAGYISEEVLNRITDAGERVQDYNLKIAEQLQLLIELRRVEKEGSPTLEFQERRLVELEKTRAGLIAAAIKADKERLDQSKKTAEGLGENREQETKEFKDAVNDQIKDAERLQAALQAAFSTALKTEGDYLREARKLRAEAGKTDIDPNDIEAQASAKLDAILAQQKLARISPTAGLEDVRDQADLVRDLAGQLEDAALKSELLKQANLAEAAALEKAAAAERERAAGLADQQQMADSRLANMKDQLTILEKGAVVEIKLGASAKASMAELREARQLIDYINSNPANIDISLLGSGSVAEQLKISALKHGRRN